VVAILAAGSLFPNSQNALLHTLVGMDQHGKVAKLGFLVSAAIAVPGFFLVSKIGWSLESAALLVVLPTNFGTAIATVLVGARTLEFSWRQYWQVVLKRPLILLLISGSCLWIVRLYGPENLIVNLSLGAIVMAIVVVLVLKEDIRDAIRSF